MEVLLLGNGFDLSLGLPTHYSEFLEFVNYLSRNSERLLNPVETTNLADVWRECGFKNVEWVGDLSLNKAHAKEIIELSDNNLWLNHFNKLLKEYTEDENKKKTWIDFENEFSKVNHFFKRSFEDGIVFVNVGDKSEENELFYEFVNEFSDLFFEEFKGIRGVKWSCKYKDEFLMPMSPLSKNKKINKEKVVSKLKEAHQNLSKMLRLYLLYFVDEPVRENIQTVKNSSSKVAYKLNEYCGFKRFDYVLTFNYTNTFEYILSTEHNYRLPKGVTSIDQNALDYIKSNPDDPIIYHLYGDVNSDIVLGYNENIPDEITENPFDYFDKSSQRLKFNTVDGFQKYNQSINIQKDNINIFVIGCSFGNIDADILKNLLEPIPKNHHTIRRIYCHDDDAKECYIHNTKRIFRENFKDYTLIGELTFIGDIEREDYLNKVKMMKDFL